MKKKTTEKSPTRAVRLLDKPLKEWLFHMCDDKLISFDGTRTGHRSFTGRVILEKKKPSK